MKALRLMAPPGHWFDTIGVAPLIQDIEFGALLGDKAFDRNAIIADLDARGASPRHIDAEILQVATPHREFLWKTQREFKRIAMRSDKTDLSFSAMIHVAAAVMQSR